MASRNDFIDFLRGSAATIVLFTHLFYACYGPYDPLIHSSIVYKVLYFIAGLGHAAVIVFFVVSGYLVGGGVVSSVQFQWKEYLIRRLGRLMVVLVPSLLLTGLWDFTGTAIAGVETYSGLMRDGVGSGPVNYTSDSFVVLLGNLVFLQTIFVETYGSNGPLWSLAYEFWYYIIFPAAWLCLRRKSVGNLVLVLTVVPVLWLYNVTILHLFSIWLLGVLVYFVQKKYPILINSSLRRYRFFVLILFGLSLILYRIKVFDILVLELFIGLSVAAVILLFSDVRAWPKASRFFSNMSFTVYLNHFYVVAFFYAVFWSKGENLINSDFDFVLVFMFITVYSYSLYYCFERNTTVITKFLRRRL